MFKISLTKSISIDLRSSVKTIYLEGISRITGFKVLQTINMKVIVKILPTSFGIRDFSRIYLNYYFSYDVCACFRLSVCLSVWVSFCKKNFLMGADIKKMLVYKVVTFLKRIKMAVLFLIFFGSDPSKMDQTWSNWISHQSKDVTVKSCHIYKKDKNGCFILDFFGSDLSKMDQTWSNLIKLDFFTNLKMLL